MKFKEMPGKAVELIKDASGAVLEGGKKLVSMEVERRRNLFESDKFKESIEDTRGLMYENLKDAGKNALLSVFDFVVATPVLTAWGLVKGPWDTLKHNMATKNPKDKNSYLASLFTGPLKGFFGGLASGTGHSVESLKKLSAAAVRTFTIGARYTVGS